MRALIRSVGLVATWATLMLAQQTPAAAHFGGGAYILVPADHVNPGEEFDVIGGDLTANSKVDFRFIRDARATTLPGDVTSGPDGHFTARLTMPPTYPSGYAMLVAEAADGTQTSTWVLVGPRTESTPAPPGRPPWWADPSVVVLGIAIVGGAGMLGYAVVRRRQSQRLPVRADSIRRRSTGGKARRKQGNDGRTRRE